VVRELSFVPGQPVFDYLRGSYPAEPAEIDIVHNGRILADDEYGRTTPGPGDFIVAMPRVAKGSSKSKNILSMVASIGLMMLSMGVGNLVESGLWRGIGVSWSNPWSYAAAMATNLVGGIAMSHWFPPAKLDMKQESLTYGWNGVQNQIGQGNPVQITFGRVRTGGQLLQSHVSVEDDKQYLNLLFCGGEGPCQYDGDGESNPDDPDDAVDHVPGIAAIQINGNPLENYSGVKVYKRAGLNHQSVIPGFADAYVEQPLSFALSAEYATATTTGDNVQGLEIALDFPTGLYRMDDGEVKSGQFRAEIQYRLHDAPEGSAWNTKEWSFSRSTRMPFKSTISIDHLNPGQYDVRVKCLAKPNSELVIQWSNLAQIIYDDFVRPGKILLAIKALATDQLSGGLPTVTWEQTRDRVWVWNPRGAAGGCYETRDADNPAWACYWLIHRLYRLTDSRTGVRHDVVRGVPVDRIDYDAFAEWARCCDGIRLDDPAGTPDPKRRLRVNLVLDTAQNLWEALRLIAPLGRGNVILKGTRYSCICDQPGQPVVQLFNMANIGLNSFNEQFADTKDRANAIEVTFFNKEKDYQRDTITVYAADYNTAATVQNPTQVTLRGCVTLEQAYRHGRYLLRTNRYNTRTCSWSAEADSIACTIGDVVAVQHDVPLWGTGGRIVAAEAGAVTLDRPVRLDEGQSYALKVRLADDTLVDKALVNTCPGGESFIETAILQVVTPFDAVPAAGDLYSFGLVQKVAKPFKILSITKDHVNQRRKISALEYNEAVYDESGDEPPALNYSAGKEALSGLIASHHIDGTGAVWLDIAWTPSRGMYYGAQVEIDGRKVQKIEAPQAAFSWQVGVPGQYAIRVAALDQFGNPCGAATLTYTATAKPAPADVSEVRLSENTFLLRDGTALSDIRVSFRPSGEIVREFRVYYALDGSAAWNFTGATPEPAYTIKAIPNTQTVTVKVCAVDRLGNESAGTVSEAFRLTGKSDPPGDVASLTTVQDDYNRARVILTWPALDPVLHPDLRGYEVRVGASWSTGTKIGGLTTDLTASYTVPASGNYAFWVKGVDNSGNSSVNAAGKSLYVEAKPNAPTAGTVVQDGNDRSNLLISWSAVSDKDLAAYEVRLGNSWDSGAAVGVTKETGLQYRAGASGVYNFMICSRNTAGFRSTVLNLAFNAGVEPSNVTGFVVEQSDTDRRILKCRWTGIADKDLAYYEIRKGTLWNSAVVVATKIGNPYYDDVATAEETATFLIKAVNKAGFASNDPAAQIVSITLTPNQPGGGSVLSDYDNRLKLKVSWEKVPDLDIDYYELKYENTVIARTSETSYPFAVGSGGVHRFAVRSRNKAGFYSSALNLAITIQAEPAAVTGFTIQQSPLDRRILQFAWNPVADSDLSHYEIRKGANWDSAAVFATGLKTTALEKMVTAEETANFLIKAITSGGVGSANAAAKSLAIALKPSKPGSGTIAPSPDNHAQLVLTWQPVADTDLVNYEIRRGGAWESATLIGTTRETSYTYPVTASGSYNFLICAKNVGGLYSNPLSLATVANIEPSDVTGFAAEQWGNDRSKVRLTWNAIPDPDLDYYEIREGANWDLGAVVATRLTGLVCDASIAAERLYRFWIAAINKAGKTSLNPAPVEGQFDLNPSPPQGLTVATDPNDRSNLQIAWTGIADQDLQDYSLKVGLDWDSGAEIARTKELKTAWKPPASGTYKFMLRARNNAGFESDDVAAVFEARIEPADVTGFVAYQNGTVVAMSWDKSPESDVVAYEIREGATFDNGAALVVTGLSETSYSVAVDTETSKRYHIKAINRAGYYSREAASAGVTIANLPPKNVMFNYNEIELQDGSHENTEFGESQFNYANFGGRFIDYPNTKFAEVGGQTVLKLLPQNLITDAHFDGELDFAKWSILGSGTLAKNAAGNLLLTSTAATAGSSGVRYKLPSALERGRVYTVELKYRNSKTGGISSGFVGSNGTSYAASNCTPASVANVYPAANQWITEKFDFTVGTSGTEPGYFLFGYQSRISGDTLEIATAKIYKKSGQAGSYAYEPSGTYYCARKDMGSVITANIVTQFISTVLLRSGVSAKLQYRVSRDGTLWTEWQDFAPVLTTFRYAEFRVLLNASDTARTPEVNILREIVDVPDVDRYGTAVIPAGGTDVAYGRKYWEPPVVNPAAIGPGLRAELISVGKEQFRVRVLNAAGADVGGTINWLARGF
jgi:predicted phage tail protein